MTPALAAWLVREAESSLAHASRWEAHWSRAGCASQSATWGRLVAVAREQLDAAKEQLAAARSPTVDELAAADSAVFTAHRLTVRVLAGSAEQTTREAWTEPRPAFYGPQAAERTAWGAKCEP